MFHVYLCYVIFSVPCSLVANYWEKADLLALLCVMFYCVFVNLPIGVPCQVSYLFTSISELCLPVYFTNKQINIIGMIYMSIT